jgi:hypothetical protein
MPVIISNGVNNVKNTPAIITDTLTNRPAATTVANGTLFVATDFQAIYTNLSGTWVQVGKG